MGAENQGQEHENPNIAEAERRLADARALPHDHPDRSMAVELMFHNLADVAIKEELKRRRRQRDN